MPRQQVYGKKRAPLASFAAYAAVLNSSSPLKPETTNGKPDADVEDVAHDLENLSIKHDSIEHVDNMEDRILKVKDTNVPGQPTRRKKDNTTVSITAVEATNEADENVALEVRKMDGKRAHKAPSTTSKRQPTPTSKASNAHPKPQLSTSTAPELINTFPKTYNSSALLEPASVVSSPPPREPTSLSLAASQRAEPESFSSWSSALEAHFEITKIAEASYGEVYRLSLLPSALEQTTLTAADESVLKIIALRSEEAADYGNKAWMSHPTAVAEEVRLLARMTDVPGFTNFRDVRVLRGRPGKAFVKAWKEYNKAAKKDDRSIFPDPARKSSYEDEQYWAVVEMQDAGVDVEKGITAAVSMREEGEVNILRTVWGVWDIFWSVALALAKGEEAAEFEHRDLHLGNICVRSTRGDAQDGCVRRAKVRLGKRKIGFTGLETTIIDYTLSRATITCDGAVDNAKEEDVAFFDLATDQMIFEGDGDVEYQYDMYRSMRAILHTDDPLASPSSSVEVLERVRRSKATWRDYCPKTNVLWLHFVLYKLMGTVDETRLDVFLDQGEDLAEGRRKEKTLRTALKKMERKLSLAALRGENALSSAGALVQFAVEQGWLDEEDVIGCSDTSIA